jgi:hypothetical protein
MGILCPGVCSFNNFQVLLTPWCPILELWTASRAFLIFSWAMRSSYPLLHSLPHCTFLAGWLSRMYNAGESVISIETVDRPNPEELLIAQEKIRNALEAVHNSRIGHHGVRRTWKLLNEHTPGHKIPIKLLEDFISFCIWCQKVRMGMADYKHPSVVLRLSILDTSWLRHVVCYSSLQGGTSTCTCSG